MDINCPNCQTAYNVPESRIGDKPKKMRCSRCKEVFTVKRRSQQTPYGYEEFYGKRDSLPTDFAFLKQTGEHPAGTRSTLPPPELVTVPPEDEVAGADTQRPPRSSAPPPIPKSKAQPATTEDAPPSKEAAASPAPNEPRAQTDASTASKPRTSSPPPIPRKGAADKPVVEADDEYEEFVDKPVDANDPFADITNAPGAPPSSAEEAAKKDAPIATAAAATADNKAAPASPKPQPAPRATPQPAPPPVDRGVEDIYPGSSWETEAPLDLGGYAVPDVQPSQSQKLGKIMGLSSAFVFLLLTFVMYRNGWSLSLSELPDQFAFAFSGEAYEELPPEVDGLEAMVEERRIIDRGKRGRLLSVVGTAYNNTPLKRQDVILKGQLIDENGDVQQELRLPCDKFFEDNALKRAAQGKIALLYQDKGKPHSCTIPGESRALFQMVFENPPADYSDAYTIKVIPVSAR